MYRSVSDELPKKVATKIGFVYEFESKKAENMIIFGDLVALTALFIGIIFIFGVL